MNRDREVVWKADGWHRQDYPTVMDGWVVRYTRDPGTPDEQQVSASRRGVGVHRARIERGPDGARLIDIIRRAWRQHEYLKGGGRPLSEMDASVGGQVVPVGSGLGL